MPGADNRLLAVDRDRPDGAPVALREDLPLDPDFGDGDMDDEPLRLPSPFIRLLCVRDAKGDEPDNPENPPSPSPEYRKLGFG